MAHFLAHLTFYNTHRLVVEANAASLGWTFRDTVMESPFHNGYAPFPSPYIGLTKHDTDEDELLYWMQLTVAQLEQIGVNVLQQKIERVIYDTKAIYDGQGYDEITPNREEDQEDYRFRDRGEEAVDGARGKDQQDPAV